jgi:hypothetical protein
MKHGNPSGGRWATALALWGGLSGGLAWAANPKEQRTALDLKEFFRPELYLSVGNLPIDAALRQLPNRAVWEKFLAETGGAERLRPLAYVDWRSGAVTNLLESVPLVPGRGDGNRLRAAKRVDAHFVESALRAHVEARRELLGIDVSQLGEARATQIHDDLWQVSIPQRYQGVVVRDARLAATISHGNLILLGTEAWGNVRGLDATPRLSVEQALEAGFGYADGRRAEDVIVRTPRLEIVPVAPAELQEGEAFVGAIGQGYGHKLVWSFVFERTPEMARWEVLVDAQDGDVLAFQDKNQYVSKSIKGGVYPLTSTDVCPNPDQCGIMQLNWPMPFADTGFPAPNDFANAHGIYTYTSGIATTTLSGRFVSIDDRCGNISNSSVSGNINLGGAPGQHDCTSGGGSPGNTPASRSVFYEVNRIAEMARGYLPGNPWLSAQLTANVNIAGCNAFWNGNTINFYRSGGGCRNTGESVSIVAHEWGHGLDDNDANGTFSNSSEGYADIASNYRLENSCMGYGTNQGSDQGCGMTADGTGFNADEAQVGPAHCTIDCSGRRDSDFAKHADGLPDTALGFACSSCLSGTGPCGRSTHCASGPQRQAAWDLVSRDLTAPPFGMDSQTAFITGNRLFYLGSGNIGLWYACTCGVSSDGCSATSGYMQWLGADDDDGNIANGTPHMTAIHAAFDRHGIACASPAPQNAPCGPTGAPTLTAVASSGRVSLSWTAVAGASGYWVYRSDGHAGCNFGKTRIGDVTTLSFNESGLVNGRKYYYNVVAHGPSHACYGPVSNCVTAIPERTRE